MSEVTIQKTAQAGPIRPGFDVLTKHFDAIRRKAYELFEARRSEHGGDVDDWLNAERHVLDALAAEFTETDGACKAEVKLPGFEAGDVTVSASSNEIVIHARRETDGNVEEEYRSFTAASPINEDRVTARLENGVLCVEAPKSSGAAAQTSGIATA